MQPLTFGGDYRLFGGAGNDVYAVDDAEDRIGEQSDEGQDRIHASISIDLTGRDGAYENVENVTLAGSADLNAYGDSADNNLSGNDGANRIAGRAGNDNLTGGDGQDLFIFRSGYARDVILDFQNNIDTIEITRSGLTTFSDARSYATQSGDHVVFDFGDGDVLTIRNTSINALADDVIFT